MHGDFFDYPLLQGDDDVPDYAKKKRSMRILQQPRGSCDAHEERETERLVQEMPLDCSRKRSEEGERK